MTSRGSFMPQSRPSFLKVFKTITQSAIKRDPGRGHHETFHGSRIGTDDSPLKVFLIKDIVYHEERSESPSRHRMFVRNTSVHDKITRHPRLRVLFVVEMELRAHIQAGY